MPLFFFNDTATTEIYTLSLHDALPICPRERRRRLSQPQISQADVVEDFEPRGDLGNGGEKGQRLADRSEEHTSELQSRLQVVCTLLLEKKKAGSASRRRRVLCPTLSLH